MNKLLKKLAQINDQAKELRTTFNQMHEKGVENVNKRINAKRTKVNKDKRITYIAT